ncbi:hypothetical protein [Isoalcanivorax beigongshangi]|uniref:Uncharacterized protein n=1 Tax=Isoalcanivorax beigongshangi TaxID=3238810 RepID=A0ABV4AFZ2_9GAMM
MSEGFELRDAQGRLRISSAGYNWHLRASRKLGAIPLTWYSNTGNLGHKYWAGKVVLPGAVNPVVAIHNPQGKAIAFRVSHPPGSAPTVSIFADQAAVDSGEVFVFDMASPPDSGDAFGLQVFDEQGRIAFSTDKWPMKIVGRHSCKVTNISTGAYTQNYVGSPPSGRKVAAWAGRYESEAGNLGVSGFHFIGTRRTGVGQIEYGGMLILYGSIALQPPLHYRAFGDSFVVIDVDRLPVPFGAL